MNDNTFPKNGPIDVTVADPAENELRWAVVKRFLDCSDALSPEEFPDVDDAVEILWNTFYEDYEDLAEYYDGLSDDDPLRVKLSRIESEFAEEWDEEDEDDLTKGLDRSDKRMWDDVFRTFSKGLDEGEHTLCDADKVIEFAWDLLNEQGLSEWWEQVGSKDTRLVKAMKGLEEQVHEEWHWVHPRLCEIHSA